MVKGRSLIPSQRKLEACLNCRTPLHGENFCPECGQENVDRNLSIRILLGDFLRDYFSFDSKFFRTMLPLMFLPGQVPLDFIQGRRVRHIPPLRILIFSSFLFFFIWGLTFDPDVQDPRDVAAQMDAQLEQGLEQQAVTGDSTIVIGAGMATININGMDSVEQSGTLMKFYQIRSLLDQGYRVPEAVDSIAIDNSEFERKLYTQMGKMYTSDSKTLAKYYISNISIIILVIQPFFALLLWLLFIRRRKEFKYVRHLVFSLYFHGWVLVLSTLALMIQVVFEQFDPVAFVVILSLIYLLLALRKFYDQAWWKSILKTFILCMLYMGTIIPFFLTLSIFLSFYFF